MPMVKYKTQKGMKTKTFPYTKEGMKQAKLMATETGGKLTKSLNQSSKLTMKKVNSYA